MKISLITVTYNSGTTLRDTIQSVLAQTYRNVEYIVVDGLSKDNTIDIVREYEPQFEGRMKWISEKDKGLYDAMNKGVRMATGDVVGILNSDDFLRPMMCWKKWLPDLTNRRMRFTVTYTMCIRTICSIACVTIRRRFLNGT